MSDVQTYSDEHINAAIETMKREIASLRTQLDQERQRREQAEGLLRHCLQACEVHQRLDGCYKCGHLIDRIDKHFGEWDE